MELDPGRMLGQDCLVKTIPCRRRVHRCVSAWPSPCHTGRPCQAAPTRSCPSLSWRAAVSPWTGRAPAAP